MARINAIGMMIGEWKKLAEESGRIKKPSNCNVCNDRGYLLAGMASGYAHNPFPGMIYTYIYLCDNCGAWRTHVKFRCKECRAPLDNDSFYCTNSKCSYSKAQHEARYIPFFGEKHRTREQRRLAWGLRRFSGCTMRNGKIYTPGNQAIAIVNENGSIERARGDER